MRPQCITKTCPQTGLECLPRWRKSGGLLKCEFTSYKFIQTACRLPTFEGCRGVPVLPGAGAFYDGRPARSTSVGRAGDVGEGTSRGNQVCLRFP